MKPDFTIWNYGIICILTPKNIKAVRWIETNIEKKGFQPWWPTRVIVDHRRILEIVSTIEKDGLTVEPLP